MGFWSSLFGRSPQSARPVVSEFERAAMEETQRRRRALEKGPRATPEQLEEEVDRLRSVNRLQMAYNHLRHSDFCDAVAEAVRRGNFSDDDATHAVYVREWVSSGAAWQTTFPEWLASAGRAHIRRLNSEWLRSGEKHLSFNDWLVGTPVKKVATAEPRAAPPAASKVRGTGWGAVPNEPPEGRWLLEDGRLVCQHNVTTVLPDQIATSVRMVCSVSRYDNGTLATYLWVELSPYLYLMEDGEPFEHHLVKPPFALGLVADGTGRGTESDPLIQGGVFEVSACASEDEPEIAALQIVSSRDTMLAIRTLGIGTDLTLTLMDYEAEPPVRLRLRLRGDPSFAELYERLRSSA